MRRTAPFFTIFGLFIAACGSDDDSAAQSKSATSPPVAADASVATPGPTAEGGTTPGSSTPQQASTLVVTNETVDVGGEKRPYVLATPSTYDESKAYPLVLVLHGDGGDGASTRAQVPFDAVSGQAAIVAYASGKNKTWDLYDPSATNSDVAYLAALVDAVAASKSIDTSRVFGLGFSSGAFMVNQVACRKPSFFKGIVPHSGGAPTEPRDTRASYWPNGYTRCQGQSLGSGPATLVIHGTSDGTVTFDSGDFTATYWAYVNGCTGERAASTPAPCVAYGGCPANRTVGICAIPSLGHAIWTNASVAAWAFFQRQ